MFSCETAGRLALGRVFDAAGSEVEGFETFAIPDPIPIRGGSESIHDFCPACGSFRYMADEDEYVLRSDLVDREFYGLAGDCFLMTRKLRERIPRGRWRGLVIEEIPIIETPRDGLDDFPENFFCQGSGPRR